ncbi:predicted protein [Postia placenta Mad-698-R]|nr:predicted protein [Postia placenta Mad-698-R]
MEKLVSLVVSSGRRESLDAWGRWRSGLWRLVAGACGEPSLRPSDPSLSIKGLPAISSLSVYAHGHRASSTIEPGRPNLCADVHTFSEQSPPRPFSSCLSSLNHLFTDGSSYFKYAPYGQLDTEARMLQPNVVHKNTPLLPIMPLHRASAEHTQLSKICMADGTSLDDPVIRPHAGSRWHVLVATLILCLALPELCVELCPGMAVMGHVAAASVKGVPYLLLAPIEPVSSIFGSIRLFVIFMTMNSSMNPTHYTLDYDNQKISTTVFTPADYATATREHYMNCNIPLGNISGAEPFAADPTFALSHSLDQHNAVSSAQSGYPLLSNDGYLTTYCGQPLVAPQPEDTRQATNATWPSYCTTTNPYFPVLPPHFTNYPSIPSSTMFPDAMSLTPSLVFQPTSSPTVGPYQGTDQRALQQPHAERYHTRSIPRHPSRYGQQRAFLAFSTIPSSALPYPSHHTPAHRAVSARVADLDPIPAGYNFDVHASSPFPHNLSFTMPSNAGPPSGPQPAPIQETSSYASRVTQTRPFFCRWEGCTHAGPADYSAITEHLRRHQVPRGRPKRKSANPVDSIKCKWAGCRLQDAVKAKNLLKHLTGTHLRFKEVQCYIGRALETITSRAAEKTRVKGDMKKIICLVIGGGRHKSLVIWGRLWLGGGANCGGEWIGDL